MTQRASWLLILVALVAGHCLLPGCTSATRAENLPGGWTATAPTDPGVQAAAAHALAARARATGERLTLIAVCEVRRQVVAGLNYRLRLQLTRDGKPAFATAVVWAKLDGTYALTAWTDR